MHWTEIVRRKHQAAQAALASSLPSISVPVADSVCTAPGWIYEGIWWTGYQDVEYPWDPDIVRFLKSFCPDVIPLTMTMVYRWSNYHELGHLGEPVVIRRHAIGRRIRDPISPVFDFPCVMPSIGFHDRPNYIETIWHDMETRPYGAGIPIGDYLPFNWEMANALKEFDDRHRWELRQSRRSADESGAAVAVGAAKPVIEPKLLLKERRSRFNREEELYIKRDLDRYYSVEPSDVEWKEKLLGEPEPVNRPTVTVPTGIEGATV